MGYSYIIIFEGGEIFKAEKITLADKMGAEAGVLEIINIADQKRYFNDSWHDLKIWGE